MRRLTTSAFLVACLCVWAPATAGAAAPVPEDFSAADQYVESVPTSEGSKPAGVGTGSGTGNANVSPAPSGVAGNKLEQIATSPELGAPRKRLHGARADEPGVPKAMVSAIGENEGSSLLPLVLGLLLVGGVVAGTAGHRHYRNRQTTDSA
jgi:hypothetical protein